MKFTVDTILNFLDNNLSTEEREAFEQATKEDEALNRLLEHHKRLHASLQQQKISSPGADFAEKVMRTVTSIDLKQSRFFNRTRVLTITLVGLIVLSSIYYLSINFYPVFGDAIANQVSLKQFTVDLNPARQIFNSDSLFKIVFYVNGVVGLLLLERAVLKPFFARRRERFSI